MRGGCDETRTPHPKAPNAVCWRRAKKHSPDVSARLSKLLSLKVRAGFPVRRAPRPGLEFRAKRWIRRSRAWESTNTVLNALAKTSSPHQFLESQKFLRYQHF